MSAYAFRNSSEIEHISSSGGAFTAILDAFVSFAGGGHNWVCIGAAFDEYLNVIHSCATDIDGCGKFRGSKYVASDITGIYADLAEALKKNKYVLFSGTPCQVNAVRNYISANNLSCDRFYAIDILCQGTPRHNLWKDFVNWLEEKNGANLKNFSFRYKGSRWKNPSCMAEFINGTVKKNTQDVRMFTTLAFTGLAYRERCYHCKFANVDRTGDITIGDFWGFEDVMPQTATKWGITANEGISLVLVNTENGRSLMSVIAEVQAKKGYRVAECDSDGYLKYQTNLQHPVNRDSKVDNFREDYMNYGFEYIVKKYGGYNTVGKLRFAIQKAAYESGLVYMLKR